MPDLDLTTDHKAAEGARTDLPGAEFQILPTSLDLRTLESAQGASIVALWNVFRRVVVVEVTMLLVVVPLIGIALSIGSEVMVRVVVPTLKYVMSAMSLYLIFRFVLPSLIDIVRMLVGVSYYRVPGENPCDVVDAVEHRWARVQSDWTWLRRMFDARP